MSEPKAAEAARGSISAGVPIQVVRALEGLRSGLVEIQEIIHARTELVRVAEETLNDATRPLEERIHVANLLIDEAAALDSGGGVGGLERTLDELLRVASPVGDDDGAAWGRSRRRQSF